MATTTAKTNKFTVSLEKIVYNPKTSEGKGFLPPLLRTLVHLAYGLGIADDELPKDAADKKNDVVIKKVKEEITEAINHCNQVEISKNFSTVGQDQMKAFLETLNALNAEFETWDRDTKVNNIQSLFNKGFGIMAMLDRELIGLRDSDPGSSL